MFSFEKAQRSFTFRLAVSLCAAVILASARPNVHSAERAFEISDPPSWVELYDAEPATEVPSDAAGRGTHYLVVDEQINLSTAPRERYRHLAFTVLSTAGLQSSTEVKISFDPSYEKLVLHNISLVRDGREIDVLQRDEVRIMQREEALDSRIYDGTLTAVLFLKDLRVGDTVDYAYSTIGSNPVFGDRFTDNVFMQYSVPVDLLRYRLVFPAKQPLRFLGHSFPDQPSVTQRDSQTTWHWIRRDVPAIEWEDQVPGWHSYRQWLQVSDFQSWADVVTWALPLYEDQSPRSGDLADIAGCCADQHTSEPERVLCVVRFVQDEIRYLGLEIGPNSHRPHPPSQVLEQRFGDCKDKSLLLISILQSLGVTAAPALVDIDTRRGLDSWLPSPIAFDHVIVHIDVEPKPVWVDATHSLQGGNLFAMQPPDFERALVIRPGSSALVDIPKEDLSAAEHISEAITLLANGTSADLKVTTEYAGSEADSTRAWLAKNALSEIGRDYLNYYAESYPAIEMTAPLQVSDDRSANRVTIEENYHLPSYWREGGRSLWATAISDTIDEPKTRLRKQPLEIARISHRVS